MEAHKLIKDYQLPGGVTFKKGCTVHLLKGAKVVAFIQAGLIEDPASKVKEVKVKETKEK